MEKIKEMLKTVKMYAQDDWQYTTRAGSSMYHKALRLIDQAIAELAKYEKGKQK